MAFTATSNILGSIIHIEEVVKAIRQQAVKKDTGKVEICIDCVAYAPHRRMDVQKWDVDFCFFSFYKVCIMHVALGSRVIKLGLQVYGPHVSVLYARSESLRALTPLTHHFLKVDDLPYKLQPGGPGYEIIYATTSVLPYLLSLTPAKTLDASFEAIAAHEQNLLEPLLQFLTDETQAKRGIRVIGDPKIGLDRVPTVSFIIIGEKAMRSQDVVKIFDQKGGVSY